MDKEQLQLTGTKRSRSEMTRATDTEENFPPEPKKQKICEDQQLTVPIILDYRHLPTLVVFDKIALSINTEGNIVSFGGLIKYPGNDIIKQHKGIVLKTKEDIIQIGFYDRDWIIGITSDKKIIELNVVDGIEYEDNQKFGSDICIDDYINYPISDDDYSCIQIAYDHAVGLNLLADGTIFSCGCNYAGTLGTGNTEKEIEGLGRISLPDEIVLVDCTSTMAICKTIKNEYYVWGEAAHRKILPVDLNLYRYDDDGDFINPTKCCNIPEDVISMKISSRNIIFLTLEGLVYKCGFEYMDENYKMIYSRIPKKIEDIPLIRKIASCDSNFSLLDFDGNLWTCDKYDMKSINFTMPSNIVDDLKLPFKPKMMVRTDIKGVIDISEGGTRTFVKTMNGDIFFFRYNATTKKRFYSDVNTTEFIKLPSKQGEKYYKLRKLDESSDIWKTNGGTSKKKSARK